MTASLKSCTFETAVKKGYWLGQRDKPFTICDTPGLNDPNGQDSSNVFNLVTKLKEVKSVDAFIVALNGQCPRLDNGIKDMLLLFKNIFGENFYKNIIIVFTRWSFDKRSQHRRSEIGLIEDDHSSEWNGQFKREFEVEEDLSVVFVDACYYRDDFDESSAFERETDKLWKIINSFGKFECKNVEAVETERDQLMKMISESNQTIEILGKYFFS